MFALGVALLVAGLAVGWAPLATAPRLAFRATLWVVRDLPLVASALSLLAARRDALAFAVGVVGGQALAEA